MCRVSREGGACRGARNPCVTQHTDNIHTCTPTFPSFQTDGDTTEIKKTKVIFHPKKTLLGSRWCTYNILFTLFLSLLLIRFLTSHKMTVKMQIDPRTTPMVQDDVGSCCTLQVPTMISLDTVLLRDAKIAPPVTLLSRT